MSVKNQKSERSVNRKIKTKSKCIDQIKANMKLRGENNQRTMSISRILEGQLVLLTDDYEKGYKGNTSESEKLKATVSATKQLVCEAEDSTESERVRQRLKSEKS